MANGKKKNGSNGDARDARTFKFAGKTYTIHPTAEIIPSMRDDEYEKLKADIAEHGVRVKVLVKGTQILDGIHRARACAELGKTPPFESYMGKEDDINAMIVSRNVHRRHLNDDQRLMLIAWSIGPELKEQAKARMTKGKEAETPKGEPADVVADQADVGQNKARKALEIAEFLPESTVKKIITGKEKFTDAAREARKRRLKASGKKVEAREPKKVDKLAPEYINKRFGMFLKHWTHEQHRKVRAWLKDYLK